MTTIQTDDQTYELPERIDDEDLIWPVFACDECDHIGKRCKPCEVEMQSDDYDDRVAESEYVEDTAAGYAWAMKAVERFQEEMGRRGIVIETPAPSEEVLEFFDCDYLRDKYLDGAKPTVGEFSDSLQRRLDEWVCAVDNPTRERILPHPYEGRQEIAASISLGAEGDLPLSFSDDPFAGLASIDRVAYVDRVAFLEHQIHGELARCGKLT